MENTDQMSKDRPSKIHHARFIPTYALSLTAKTGKPLTGAAIHVAVHLPGKDHCTMTMVKAVFSHWHGKAISKYSIMLKNQTKPIAKIPDYI